MVERTLTYRGELNKSEGDISFGLVAYFPITKLSSEIKDKLISLLKEESEFFLYEEVPFAYFVIDIGKRIQFGSYLLTRIIKEVFSTVEENDISFKLISEGELPYIGLDENHPETS